MTEEPLELVSAPRPDDDRIPIDDLEFRECPQCAAKPGPGLCASCIHNRAVISRLPAVGQDTGGITVDGVMAARRRMCKRIADAIGDFEEFSGLVVDAVSIERIDARTGGEGNADLLVAVTTDVRLPR